MTRSALTGLGCRYDDRNHWLFRTLHTQHNMDYHQACIKGATIEKGGVSCLASPCTAG